MANNMGFWSQTKPINKKGFRTLHNRLSAERNERLKWKFIFWVLLVCFISVVISLWVLRNRLIQGIEYINPVSNRDISGVRFTEKELREFFEKNNQEMPNNHEWLIQPEFHFIEKAQAKTEKDVSPQNEIESYIYEKFGSRGADAVKMLKNCENRHLNPSVVSKVNRNGTVDVGLFQINVNPSDKAEVERLKDYKYNTERALTKYHAYKDTFYLWTCGNYAGDYTYVDYLKGR